MQRQWASTAEQSWCPHTVRSFPHRWSQSQKKKMTYTSGLLVSHHPPASYLTMGLRAEPWKRRPTHIRHHTCVTRPTHMHTMLMSMPTMLMSLLFLCLCVMLIPHLVMLISVTLNTGSPKFYATKASAPNVLPIMLVISFTVIAWAFEGNLWSWAQSIESRAPDNGTH